MTEPMHEQVEAPPLTRDALLAELRSWQGETDPEIAHAYADALLLRYIADPEIAAAYEAITRWYA